MRPVREVEVTVGSDVRVTQGLQAVEKSTIKVGNLKYLTTPVGTPSASCHLIIKILSSLAFAYERNKMFITVGGRGVGSDVQWNSP